MSFIRDSHAKRRRVHFAFAILFVASVVSGCEGSKFGAREAGALGGAALGAGLGAIVGNQTGSTGAGIAIGSAVGALSGGLIGNEIDKTNDQIAERDARIEAQERAIEENRKILEELRGRGVDARVTSRGVVANLPDVLFNFGSASLTGEADRRVQEIAGVVRGVNGRRISVEGHTDSVGTAEFNQRLSEDRARNVARALERDGVAHKRLSVRGYGEREPIASNSSAAGRQKNRRVEVIVENR